MEATGKYDFDAAGDDELTFRRGDQIKILRITDNWYKAEFRGVEGFVPKNFIDFQLPSWYQEDLKRRDAQQRLMSQPLGTFLIRSSQNEDPGNFSISVRYVDKVQHFKVMRDRRGQYYIWLEKFPSLNKLVEFYKENSISKHNQILLLETQEEGKSQTDLPPLPAPRLSISQPAPAPRQSKTGSTASLQVKALYNFHAEEADELDFSAGDIIQVIERPPDQEWWKGQLRGKTGLFPSNHTEAV